MINKYITEEERRKARNKYKRNYWKKYKQKVKKSKAEYSRKYNSRKRGEVMILLGGKCCKCGFSDYRALQIDHVNGGGVQKDKDRIGYKIRVILEEIKNGSKDYQLLCANCNWIKRFEKGETTRKY
jgi:5-methylcytosine-specific restriction endonuclease McrA